MDEFTPCCKCGKPVKWDSLHEWKEPGKVGKGTIYCDDCCPGCWAQQKEFAETERLRGTDI